MNDKKSHRKFFVLKEVEISIHSLKKGDIFRIEKASSNDIVNESQLYMAESECYKKKKLERIDCCPIDIIKTIAHDAKYDFR